MTIWDFLASSGFSALAGVFVAAGLAFLFTEVRERRAFRQGLRKLAIEAALQDWRSYHKERTARLGHHAITSFDINGREHTLDAYMARMFDLMDVASEDGKSLKATANILRQRE